MRDWIRGPRPVLAILALAAVCAIGFALHLKSGAGFLIGAYIGSTLLCARALAMQLQKLPPELPLHRTVLRGRRAIVLPVAAFLLLSVLREGGAFDLAWNRASSERSSGSQLAFSSAGTAVPVLRGRPASCTLPQQPSSIARGFGSFVRCAEQGAPIHVDISLTANDAFCYTPLLKSATVSYSAVVSLGASSAGGQIHGTITIRGQIRQTMTGIGSCRAFNEQLGRGGSDQPVHRAALSYLQSAAVSSLHVPA